MKITRPENLSIVFNITGKRDEKPLLDLLAELNPRKIFLTPNIAKSTTWNADQDNRNNPLSVVSSVVDNFPLVVILKTIMEIQMMLIDFLRVIVE